MKIKVSWYATKIQQVANIPNTEYGFLESRKILGSTIILNKVVKPEIVQAETKMKALRGLDSHRDIKGRKPNLTVKKAGRRGLRLFDDSINVLMTQKQGISIR